MFTVNEQWLIHCRPQVRVATRPLQPDEPPGSVAFISAAAGPRGGGSGADGLSNGGAGPGPLSSASAAAATPTLFSRVFGGLWSTGGGASPSAAPQPFISSASGRPPPPGGSGPPASTSAAGSGNGHGNSSSAPELPPPPVRVMPGAALALWAVSDGRQAIEQVGSAYSWICETLCGPVSGWHQCRLDGPGCLIALEACYVPLSWRTKRTNTRSCTAALWRWTATQWWCTCAPWRPSARRSERSSCRTACSTQHCMPGCRAGCQAPEGCCAARGCAARRCSASLSHIARCQLNSRPTSRCLIPGVGWLTSAPVQPDTPGGGARTPACTPPGPCRPPRLPLRRYVSAEP